MTRILASPSARVSSRCADPMNGYEFCKWFEGALDMNPDGLDVAQTARVRERLKSVKSPQQVAEEQNRLLPSHLRDNGRNRDVRMKC